MVVVVVTDQERRKHLEVPLTADAADAADVQRAADSIAFYFSCFLLLFHLWTTLDRQRMQN